MTTAEQQYQQDQIFEVMQRQTKGRVCRVSGKPPVLVRHQDAWVATCADHRPNPCLWKKDDSQKERYGAMVNHAMAVRPERMPMSVNEIKQFISPMATEAEAYIFLRFCQAQGLNPFVNDAYLIKYDPKGKAAIVIGIQALLKRAESNPNYTGYQAGVVVLRNGEPLEMQGSLVYKDSDVLVGGWAAISRKDWPKPTKITVALKEYNKRQAQWNERPATMIEKVALAQGLRRVFPQEVGTLFERQELETEVGEVEGITVQSLLPPEAPERQERHTREEWKAISALPESASEGATGGVGGAGVVSSTKGVMATPGGGGRGEPVAMFATLGDLYVWATTIGYPTVKSRMDVPGVKEAIEARDYTKAAQLLTAAKKE